MGACGARHVVGDPDSHASATVAALPAQRARKGRRDSPLVDTVRSVRQDRGMLVVRLTRFTVQVPPSVNGDLRARPRVDRGSARFTWRRVRAAG
ncbi:MAG: hypothetical protein M3076_04600 [Actinomycetota bacterium]|nr:hypothetical protein [Actinomycetota bacterium]